MAKLQMSFAQIDPTAKGDITALAAGAYKPWSVLNDLRYDNIPLPEHFATLEHNYTVLDGTADEFPDNPGGRTWGLWSDAQSDESGSFAAPPTLDISFAAYHKSLGLTMYFYPHTDDYAARVRVTWYSTTTATTVIKTGIYDLRSVIGVVRENVIDFRHIRIEFLTTNHGRRFVKLFALDYGIIRTIEDGEINTCRVLEEVDPTVESISINTMNANIRTRDSIFSPVTSEEPDDMMMRRQMLTLTRDGAPFGTYFLETWEDVHQSGIEFNVTAGDAMGILDLYHFNGGLYTNKLVAELLDEIFTICFPTRLITYRLDETFAGKRVTGWIPYGTCGLAFQHLMFALNAVSDSSRIGDIWIYPRDTLPTFTVPMQDQYRAGRDSPTEYVSSVEIVSHNYVPSSETTEAQNGALPLGQNTIRFTEPLHTLTITGGTILSSGANHAVINVTTTGNVVLTGRKYIDNRRVHTARSDIAAGEVETVKSYENYTLVSPDIGQWLADALFAWYQNRIRTETDVILGDMEAGYMARVKTRGRDVVGTITRLDSNPRANKAKMEVIGYVDRSGL